MIRIIISLLLLVILLVGVFFIFSITGNVISEERDFDYTWTTAICDGNECQDFEVKCLGGDVVEMNPVSGLVVFGEDFEDIREDRELCE